MRKVIPLIVVIIQFLLGSTTALAQKHDKIVQVNLTTKITAHQHAILSNSKDPQSSIEVLVPDFDEEISGNETLPLSFKQKISVRPELIIAPWHSFPTNISSQEFFEGNFHYLPPFIGFSTPIYITQRVIRI